jgi:hypothetical protein
MATKRTYKASIYFQGEIEIYVRAENERKALSIAKKRIAKRKIGSRNIRSDFSGTDEVFHTDRQ